MLLAAVELKLLPLIVTVVPTGPEVGLKELITGCAFIAKKVTVQRVTKAVLKVRV